MFGIDGTGEIIKDVGGVMVSVFTSSAVDRGYKPQSSETKDYKIVFVASPLKIQH